MLSTDFQRPKAVRITKDLDMNLAHKDVILVEDIVDTGMSLKILLDHLESKGPASLEVCALLDKRARRLADVPNPVRGVRGA
jgi:hypoxanthine phosphoribosyltransferase